jgi:uncharacterized RmlC-like cupin family protein
MAMETAKWQADSVTVVPGASLKAGLSQRGRATAFDFAGSDGTETWIGAVSLPPNGKTGAHHHGRTEVAIYVVKGRGQICWGERLEFAAEVGPGDFVYFTPYVPHHELNLDPGETLDFVVVRSNDEGITVGLDLVPVSRPDTIL